MDLTLEEPIYDAVAEDEEAFFAINNHLNGVGKLKKTQGTNQNLKTPSTTIKVALVNHERKKKETNENLKTCFSPINNP